MNIELKAFICMSCSEKYFSFKQNEGTIPDSLISNDYVLSKRLFCIIRRIYLKGHLQSSADKKHLNSAFIT